MEASVPAMGYRKVSKSENKQHTLYSRGLNTYLFYLLLLLVVVVVLVFLFLDWIYLLFINNLFIIFFFFWGGWVSHYEYSIRGPKPYSTC